ncbi:hypothetical protein [Bizionia paragorgiae]|uniref:hypothetical protein n=1 Tax=Bizionia paragorgiae TaxID=283786 RepID=UPI001FE1D808|nr:hypothetical protein [Bizionia paragorgiae]
MENQFDTQMPSKIVVGALAQEERVAFYRKTYAHVEVVSQYLCCLNTSCFKVMRLSISLCL